MAGRLPLVLGAVAALATLLVVGPVALAVALIRSSPDGRAPDLAAQILILALALATAALAGWAVRGLTRRILRLLRRDG
jgi:small neutral amino acid transporter SnatA (MarC family)